MDKSKCLPRAPVVSVLITIVISHLIIVSIVGVAGAEDQAPTAVERGINFNSPFQKLRSLIKLAWAHFKIPDSERIKGGGSNAGVKSDGKSEEASESMGKAAGDAVHQAAEKVKTTISHNNEQDQKEL